jgi:hypothetical protein
MLMRSTARGLVLAFAPIAGLMLAAGARAATTPVDLDANAANGAESQCDLNVLQTFPVMIEDKVTNRTNGDAFNFAWASAGPGGFSSSVPAGTTGGVGAKWVWTTNQSVYAFTGSACANDACFSKTAGPDPLPGTCTLCTDDGVTFRLDKDATFGEAVLSWQGGQGLYAVYRGTSARAISDAANVLTTTDQLRILDLPPAGTIFFYQVRGTSCVVRRTCAGDADCAAPASGTCANRGPFGVPGRSLFSNDVTVSSASLTSSLITFFSPPTEIFRVTSSAGPGGVLESVTNTGAGPVTLTVPGYPPGCCPFNPYVPHQLRCGATCVDYLNDNDNCGACGNVCDENTFCWNGSCQLLCDKGDEQCGSVCVQLWNDPENCGECGNVCPSGDFCSDGYCEPSCDEGQTLCGGVCVDLQTDVDNCGGCGQACNEGDHCVNGSCAPSCGESETLCDGECTDTNWDSNNCGECGNVCEDDKSCVWGMCSDPKPLDPGSLVCSSRPGPDPLGHRSARSLRRPPAPPRLSPDEASVCTVNESTQTIDPGHSTSTCTPGGVIFKEVPTEITVCGDGFPGVDGVCPNGTAKATTGTFNRLVADATTPVGDAFVTPYKVHVVSDTSHDGLLEPGEDAELVIETLNAGPLDITNATATLSALDVDLSNDGLTDPVGLDVSGPAVTYGTIHGTPATGDCSRPPLQPAANTPTFSITVPPDHPGDTSHPVVLTVNGIVNGAPFTQDVPLSLGIADTCDFSAHTRDFDALAGLLNSMAPLVPVGDTVPFPAHPFVAGNDRLLRLRTHCGVWNLTNADVDAPEIIALTEDVRGSIDLTTLFDERQNAYSRFFTWNESESDLGHDQQLDADSWEYLLRTSNIGPGTYTITIRIAGRKDYVTGFVLH